MRDADKKDTRILIQTHPDVLIVPPDPPQNLIKVGQLRTLIHRAHYIPTEAPARVFLLTSSAFMKEAANSLLKLLEEPPNRVHLILLAENPGELLPTIRSPPPPPPPRPPPPPPAAPTPPPDAPSHSISPPTSPPAPTPSPSLPPPSKPTITAPSSA